MRHFPCNSSPLYGPSSAVAMRLTSHSCSCSPCCLFLEYDGRNHRCIHIYIYIKYFNTFNSRAHEPCAFFFFLQSIQQASVDHGRAWFSCAKTSTQHTHIYIYIVCLCVCCVEVGVAALFVFSVFVSFISGTPPSPAAPLHTQQQQRKKKHHGHFRRFFVVLFRLRASRKHRLRRLRVRCEHGVSREVAEKRGGEIAVACPSLSSPGHKRATRPQQNTYTDMDACIHITKRRERETQVDQGREEGGLCESLCRSERETTERGTKRQTRKKKEITAHKNHEEALSTHTHNETR